MIKYVLIPCLALGSTLYADEPPLRLEDCIEYARVNSPSLIQSRLRHSNQELEITVQRAFFDPTLRGDTQRSDGQVSSRSHPCSTIRKSPGVWIFPQK